MRSFILAYAVAASIAAPGARAADYAPLDCRMAEGPALSAICSSYALGQAEARMATLYAVATSLVAMGQRGDLADAQRAWLAERNLCGDDTVCLRDAYTRRIRQLDAVIAGIASRGPY